MKSTLAGVLVIPLIAVLAAFNFDLAAIAQTNGGTKLVPTVTIPAPPGSHIVGGGQEDQGMNFKNQDVDRNPLRNR